MKTLKLAAVAALVAMTALPSVAKETVLVVGAHPDDDIAMAGTMYLMRDLVDVHIAVLTRGDSTYDRKKGLIPGSKAAIRTAEEESAAKLVGAKVHWLDYRDGDLYATEDACRDVKNLILELKPRAVFAMWPIDRHTDHAMAGTIVLKGARQAKYQGEFYYYEEVYGSKGFVPMYFVDITKFQNLKQKYVRSHVCQNLGDDLNIVEMHGARGRGYQSMYNLGRTHAECFAPLMGFQVQGSRCIFTELPKP